MRGTLLAVTVVFVCWIGLPSLAAAQQTPHPLTDLVLAGAPLVASTGMPSAGPAVSAAASSAMPSESNAVEPAAATGTVPGLEPGADPQIEIPNPLNLLGSLDPRDWASAILDTVIETIAGALLDAIRGFVDWALGFGDSSLNFITQTPAAGTYESSTVRTLWDFSRAIANAGLAVIVMWGGFNVVIKEHTRAPYDGVMELLPRVILAALALNLTLEIARGLIELNNAFAGAIGEVGLPGYDQANANQSGMAMIMVAVTYGIVALLLAFQMLARLALINILIVLAPVMVLTWVLPQTQSWARWWAHLLPITIFQQAVQVMALRLGSALMVELTPGSVSNALLTLLLGIAVCYLTLRVPTLLSSQARYAGLSSVVSLVVLSRAAGGLGSRGAGAAAGGR
ncbi:MAG: hypothetical protein GEU80_07165 [Dehalococcoidia bacterium]|nr:hypothetical protein [Dehalococcoidia bacterium]